MRTRARNKFRKRSPAYAARIAQTSWEKECAIADLLSEGMDLRAISEEIGLAYSSVTIYWRRIRHRMGGQAV